MKPGCRVPFRTWAADDCEWRRWSGSIGIWWHLHVLRRTKNNTEGFSSVRDVFPSGFGKSWVKDHSALLRATGRWCNQVSPHAMTSSVALNREAAPKRRNKFILKKKRKKRRKKKKKRLLLGWQYKVFRETKHGFIQDLNVSEADMCRHCSNEPSKTKALKAKKPLFTFWFFSKKCFVEIFKAN